MSTNEHRLIQEQLNEYPSLSPAAQRQIDEHLADCAECAAYLEQMQQTDQAIRQMAATQRVYATRHYLGESKSRLSNLGKELAHPDNRWKGAWRGNTTQVGKLAGVALLLLLAIGLSFIFSNSRFDQQQITPQATATLVPFTDTGIVTLTFGCETLSCPGYIALADKFHRQHDNIYVSVVDINTLITDTQAIQNMAPKSQLIADRVDAAELPSIAGNLAVNTFVDGIAVDLAPLMQRDDVINIANYYPAAQEFLRGEQVYLLPSHVSPVVILYDPVAFDQAGIAYPSEKWTTDQLFKAAEQLTIHKDGSTRRFGLVSLQEPFLPNHAFVFGQLNGIINPIDDAPTRDLSAQELIDAIQRFAKLIRQEKAMPNFVSLSDEENRLLQTPRSATPKWSAMWISDHRDLIHIAGSDKLDGLRVAALPSAMQPFVPPLVGPFHYISNRSQHIEESWLWLKFLAESANAQKLSIPALRSRAQQPDAWSTWALQPADKETLLSIAAKPTSIMRVKEDSGYGTFGNMLGLVDQEIRVVLSPHFRLEEETVANSPTVRMAIEHWQGLLAKQEETQPITSSKSITLTFGCNRELCAQYTSLAEQFHQQHPNLSVELVNFESQLRDNNPTYTFDDYIQTLRSKADAADLSSFGNIRMHPWADEIAVDLGPFLKRDPLLNLANLYPVAQQFLMSDTNYLLPAYVSPVVILYDPTVFDQAGLRYPTGVWSTEELFSTAAKLTIHDDKWVSRYGLALFDNGGFTLANHAFVLGQLDHIVDPATLAPLRSINEQELTDAVYRFANLVRTERAIPNFVDPLAVDKQLLTGEQAEIRKKAAMWVGNPFGFMTYAPGDLDNVGVATLPAQMQPFAPPILGSFRFISNQSQHVEESWLWLKFLAQNAQVEDLSLPTLRSRAEQPEAWSQSPIHPLDRIKLLSLVSQPAPILNLKKDFSNGSLASMLALIDEEVRFSLSRKVRLEDKPIASRGNMKLVAEQWQTLFAQQAPKQSAKINESTTISFLCARLICPEYQPLVEEFHQQYPNIQVELKELESIKATSARSITEAVTLLTEAADTSLAVNFPLDWQEVATHYADLQPFIDNDPEFDSSDFYPSALVPTNQGIKQIPATLDPYLIIYDKAAFDDAKLAYPTSDWTRQDLLNIAHQLTSRNGGTTTRYGFFDSFNSGLALMFDQILDAYLQGDFSEATKPEIMSAIRWYTDLVGKEAVMPNPQQISSANQTFEDVADTLVSDKKVVMWTGDLVGLARQRASNPNLGIVAPPNNNYEIVGGAGPNYVINAKTAYPQASWLWIKFLTHHSVHSMIYGDKKIPLLAVPARRSVAQNSGYWDQWTPSERPDIERILENVDIRPSGEAQVRFATAFSSAIESVFAGESVEQALMDQGLTPQPIETTSVITITSSCTNDQSCAYYQRLAEQFHQQNPTIFVNVQARTAFLQDGKATENTQEDEKQVAVNVDVGEIGSYGAKSGIRTLVDGLAVDLSTQMQHDADLQITDFYSAAQQLMQAQPMSLMPTHVSPIVLLYDQKAFEEAGIPVPATTWSTNDLLNIAERLTIRRDGITQRYGLVSLDGFYVPYHAFVLGQLENLFDPKTNLSTRPISEDELVKAVQRYTDLVEQKQVIPNPELTTGDGELLRSKPRSQLLDLSAMWISNHTNLSFFDGPKNLDGLQIAPLPESMQTYAPPLFGPLLYISKFSNHQQSSWLWLKFLVQNAEADKLSIPALIQRANDQRAWSHSALSNEQADMLRTIANRPLVPVDELETWNGTLYTAFSIIDDAVRSVLSNQSDLNANISTSRSMLNTFLELWQEFVDQSAEANGKAK